MTNVLLEIKNIKKLYKADKKEIYALKGISLDIYEQEIISLLGINGAGKTTLSSIIATLLKPSFGNIYYKNSSIYDDIVSFRKMLGFCPQSYNLDFDLTVKENLIFAGRYYALNKKVIKKRVTNLLEKFDLGQYQDFQLDSLSGGYKQRFMIARTLMHDPKIIIMDEPTVGLDPQARRVLWKHILDLKNENKTVLLTTHYLDEADILSDRICVIDVGKIQALNTPFELKKQWKNERLEDVFLQLINQKEESNNE